MKIFLPFFLPLIAILSLRAQTTITSITTSTSAAITNNTYTSGSVYKWGFSPNNTITRVTGITAVVPYVYASSLTGNVRLRRVNNANVSGNFTLLWSECNAASRFDAFCDYPNTSAVLDNMATFFNDNVFNKGTDNFFDNTGTSNVNDIERLDWLLNTPYTVVAPASAGIAVFERGAAAAHDNFVIAAVLSVDGSGNPASYGPQVRVATGWGATSLSTINYGVYKAAAGSNLLEQNGAVTVQDRGGVFVSFTALGITGATTQVFGYSLFAFDLPVAANSAAMVNVANATNFPLTTLDATGGVDLIATTGIFALSSLLPVRFTDFFAADNNGIVNLKWNVENEKSVSRYDIERSTNGFNFIKINQILPSTSGTLHNNYMYDDNTSLLSATKLYYRLKQYDLDGSYHLSKIIVVNKDLKKVGVSIYPNPVTEDLFIHITSLFNENATMQVINAAGVPVAFKTITLSKGHNSYSLHELANMASGTYQIAISYASGNVITKQFVKQ